MCKMFELINRQCLHFRCASTYIFSVDQHTSSGLIARKDVNLTLLRQLIAYQVIRANVDYK